MRRVSIMFVAMKYTPTSSVNSSWLRDDVTLGSIVEFTILCLFTVWAYASRIASSFSHYEFPDKISILFGCTSWITITIGFQSLPAKWTHKLGGPPLPPTSYMYLHSPSLVSLVLSLSYLDWFHLPSAQMSVPEGDAAKGAKIFKQRCAQCHTTEKVIYCIPSGSAWCTEILFGGFLTGSGTNRKKVLC